MNLILLYNRRNNEIININLGTNILRNCKRDVWISDEIRVEIKPKKIRRVVPEKTSRQMMEILKFAVKNGTGKKAAIDGFDVAGKTGTAQKYNTKTRSYSKTEFISSFIGYAPADAPRLVSMVRCASGVIRMAQVPVGSSADGVVSMLTPRARMSSRKNSPMLSLPTFPQ